MREKRCFQVPITTLEAAAKLRETTDCSASSCPHSGPTKILDDRQALIAADTQVLYTQTQQLFPGPDDTVTFQMKIAIDQEAEIIYWLVPQPANGVVSLVCLDKEV